jgi:hypothetical protein
MTEAQQAALAHPCRFAFETGRPELRRLIEGGRYSLVLSINYGYE